MSEIYTVIVGILGILAVSGLFVGVTNDAVNFLNSAIGSKAASMKVILTVASVGIIIGAAFTAIVTSFVSDIVQPFIVLITGGGTGVSGLVIPVAGTPNGIDFGAFISAIINFLIVAFVLFLVLKAFNAVFNKKKEEAEEAPAEPTTKVCPYCQSEISIKAVRCPQCTSKLEGFPEIND